MLICEVIKFLLINKQPSASNNPEIYSTFNRNKYVSSKLHLLLSSEHVKCSFSLSSFLLGKFANLLKLYKL